MRHSSLLLPTAAFLLTTAAAFGQAAPQTGGTKAAAAARPSAVSTTAANADADTVRAVSPDTATLLASTAPKFVAPKKESSEATDSSPVVVKPAEQEAAADRDQPRNTIVRLPEFVVPEDKAPAFKERETLTPAGRVAMAFRRHPGLRILPLSALNRRPGLEMLEEEERLERISELADLNSLQFISEPPAAAKSRRAAEAMLIRSGP